ncbi:hypothetical protein K438DRAFT_1972096 [Mycena galopus ATCC 62051]|nr:hypothetical protein K438DRAFT_1972096 [Mycena galopus ATCC 62051]
MANIPQTSSQHTSTSTCQRRTFSNRISAMGAKINRTLSNEGKTGAFNSETERTTSTTVESADRSTSCSRNNFVTPPTAAALATSDSPSTSGATKDFPLPRRRERAHGARATSSVLRSTGRGGSGNFSQRPPATDPSYSLRDREILRAHAEADKTALRSSCRGGIGNIITPHISTPSASRFISPIASP